VRHSRSSVGESKANLRGKYLVFAPQKSDLCVRARDLFTFARQDPNQKNKAECEPFFVSNAERQMKTN
jgi:hypothetical protein